MKKNLTKKDIARSVSLWLGVILLLFLTSMKLFIYKELHFIFILSIVLISSLAAYILTLYYVEQFIYRRIKVIYKLIHSLKKGNRNEGNPKEDQYTLDEVENEVKSYSRDVSEELAERVRMEKFRREFLGNVSHELKTPLFNLQGYLGTLIEGGIEDNKINMDYLVKANKNVTRMAEIVNELILINQYESAELNPKMEPFDIVSLTKEVMESLELMADNQNISIGFKDPVSNPIVVLGDREYIKQVLTNLISNSIKYGKEDGKTKISFYDVEENILIEVSDDGPGIKEQHLKRLFERFYRVDSSRNREDGGTGLGLAIVKHIVEAHGQTINVRSKVDIGSTFGFTLKKA